jgi:MoaD family protein
MPQITVKYLMVFSQITGKKSEKLHIEDTSTVDDMLKTLYHKYGRKLKKAIETSYDHRSVVIAVNGEVKERTTKLEDGDEVLISYPVGGG